MQLQQQQQQQQQRPSSSPSRQRPTSAAAVIAAPGNGSSNSKSTTRALCSYGFDSTGPRYTSRNAASVARPGVCLPLLPTPHCFCCDEQEQGLEASVACNPEALLATCDCDFQTNFEYQALAPRHEWCLCMYGALTHCESKQTWD
jgi:hypothetical protein